jgi:hypothetical protein
MEKTNQIPIWFFIGALVAVYGFIILGTGIMALIRPPAVQKVLGQLHADIWWGALLLAVGTVYVLKYRPGKKD